MSTMPAPTARPHLHVSLPALREWGFGALALAWYAISTFVLGLPGFLSVFVFGLLVMLTLAPAHVSQHVAAVTHAYESRIFNPPETKS